MSPNPTDQRLRELLREGDPAADRSALSSQESVALRRVVLREVRTRRPLAWVSLGAAGAAAALAIVLLLTQRTPGASHTAATGKSPGGPHSTSLEKRQVQFATERGTQIIWVLDPDLDL